MNFPINSIRDEFATLKTKVYGQNLVYMDSAATTLKPKVVVDEITQYYLYETANVHRGLHFLSEQATTKFEKTRDLVKDFINANTREEIIFTKGTTNSINLVAKTYGEEFLKEDDEILISHMEHHSNIVPWQILCEKNKCKLKIIPITDQGDVDYNAFLSLLSAKTKFVSIVYVSNALGTINPIQKMIQDIRKYTQAKVLVDAAQAVAHLQVNVQLLDCDFLAFSGHKLFGPTGIGVLYGKKPILEAMPPFEGGGDMIDTVTFDKTTYNDLPYKFEAGTPHIAGVIGLGKAIQFVNDVGIDLIYDYEKKLLQYGQDKLSQIAGLKIIGTSEHKASLFTFVYKDIHPQDISVFMDQKGIAIRTGHHCAQPVMQRFNVNATARASLSIYNTVEEIDIFVERLKKIDQIFN